METSNATYKNSVHGNRSVLGVFQQIESWAISVNQQRCVKVRNRNVSCLKCAEACTSGCISLADEELVVDSSKCVGCGTCATVCPTCALESRNPTDAELLQECLAKGEKVVIACQPLRNALKDKFYEDSVVGVVCLGRIDESLVVSLAAHGVAEVSLVCGQCLNCEQKLGQKTASLVKDTTEQLLSTWNTSMHIEINSMLPEDTLVEGVSTDVASRLCKESFSSLVACRAVNEGLPNNKELDSQESTAAQEVGSLVNNEKEEVPAFAFAERKDAEKLQEGLLHVMKDGTLPHFVPDRRERLLNSLARLGTPQKEDLQVRLWGSVVIDAQKCISCRMCATFCPTGAIVKFDEEGGAFGVDHYPADCVKCKSCYDICPVGAIILLDSVKPQFLLESAKHHYTMRAPDVELGTEHQILNTMKERMKGTNLFER